ncbi:dihydrodipicolinate synthase family protein [Nonomuraea sp. NPDC050153]|uniref:dihydrodipicolinate synthase family protein n=1 Tax=Nonomuraea sp. NPDC050153 TaxID=3364359 RepID=UPI0037930D20
MKSVNLRGIISTVVTPFDDNDQVDYDLLRSDVRYLLDSGVHGICACGSTGEGQTLSAEESAEICRVVVDEVAGAVPVVGGIIRNSTAEVLTYARALKAAGVDALQITPVHYVFAPSDDQTVDYYRTIGTEIGLPIVVYNVVPWALVRTPVLRRLIEIPEVVAIKQSGGDMHLLADILAFYRDDITVLAALDDLHYPAFALGAHGALAAIPTVTPKLSVQLWDAVQAGDHKRARDLHEAILRVWRELDGPDLPERLKAALNLQGRKVGRPRHPFTPAAPETVERIRTVLDAAGLLT